MKEDTFLKKTRKLLALLMALAVTLPVLTFLTSAATKPDKQIRGIKN